jgi:ArsR family transcriptional regulator
MKKNKVTSAYSKEFYQKAADLFKVMSNAKRLEILNSVKDREVTVNDLSGILGTRKSNTSQHLSYLRYVGLVTARRQGKNIFYKLTDPRITEPCKVFSEIFRKNSLKSSKFI